MTAHIYEISARERRLNYPDTRVGDMIEAPDGTRYEIIGYNAATDMYRMIKVNTLKGDDPSRK